MSIREKLKENKGSSLITVLAVITIVMVVVFSVLAMAYRYYSSESGSIYRQKGDEAARSLSDELGDELMKTHYASADAAAADNGLWQYLRQHMGKTGWSYYDSGKFTNRQSFKKKSDTDAGTGDGADADGADLTGLVAANLDAAKKYFELDTAEDVDPSNSLKDEIPEIEVAVYWELGKYKDRLNSSRVYVEVSCRMGDHVTVVTKRYKLSTRSFDGVESNADEDKLDWVWTYDGEV